MKIFRIFMLPVLLLGWITLQSCNAKKDTPVIAKVGNKEITFEKFLDRYNKYLFSTGIKDNYPTREYVLDHIITEELLCHYENNFPVKSSAEYLSEKEWMAKQTVLAFLKDREIYANISVSEEELKQTFLKANQRLAARHLFAANKEEAEKLYDMVNAGVSFDILANKVFSDDQLKNNGGYLGYFSWGDMDPAFEKAAYSMKPGEISRPVKTEFGYSVIKLEDKVTRPLLTRFEFDKARHSLTRELKIWKKPQAEREYVQNLVDFDVIRVDKPLTEKLFVNFISGNGFILNEEIPENKVVVTYKDKEFLYQEIVERLENLPSFQMQKISSPKRLETVLRGMILQDILLAKAYKSDYQSHPDVIDAIEKLNINLTVAFKKAEIVKNASIPDTVAEKFYHENIEFFSTYNEVNVLQLTTDSEEKANELLTRINEGADFRKLAKKESLNEQTAVNGGETGFIPVKNFIHAGGKVWNAKKNEVVGPFQSGNNWVIVKVLDKREGAPLPFSEVKEEAVMAAKYYNSHKIMYDYVAKLRNNVPVVIDTSILAGYKKMGLDKKIVKTNIPKKGVTG